MNKRKQFTVTTYIIIRPEIKECVKVFYLPTDAQVNCFKRNIKIYIKAAAKCFGLITIIRERIIRAG